VFFKEHTRLKQKGAYALFCFFLWSLSFSQINLVPNPSFEDTIGIPRSFSELNKCQLWYSPSNTTPDYYSAFSPLNVIFPQGSVHIPKNCVGYQNARTGNFYTGIITRDVYPPSAGYPPEINYTEKIGIRLLQPLMSNHSYSFTMYYSLADGSTISTNQLSAYFSVNQFTISTFSSLDTNNYFNYLSTQINHDNSFITDTVNWIPLTGCFIAKGGEEYLTVGNFKDGVKSATLNISTSNPFCPAFGTGGSTFCYIYIDDVSLYDLGYYSGPASCKNDTLICGGNSVTLSNNIKDSSVVAWNPSTALSCTNCVNTIATPTISTLYYLNKSICGANSKDSILVQVHTPTTNAYAGNDKTICIGDYVQLGTSDSLAFTNYTWQNSASLSCSNCAMPFANPNVTTTYTVQRTECTYVTTDTVKIIIDDCDPVFVLPNVFTPNADGINDTWGINFSTVNSHLTNFKMSIYDRWGLLVYSTNYDLSTPNSKWDGRTTAGIECTSGVYYYIITFEKNEEHVLLKGHLSLFR
jgi:gliding motility-associated-like protein